MVVKCSIPLIVVFIFTLAAACATPAFANNSAITNVNGRYGDRDFDSHGSLRYSRHQSTPYSEYYDPYRRDYYPYKYYGSYPYSRYYSGYPYSRYYDPYLGRYSNQNRFWYR